MKEQRKIPLTHIMIIGAFIFAFLQVVLLASLVHAVNVNNEIQEGLFQSGRIMVESLQHILSVQTGINLFSPRPMMTAAGVMPIS